MGPDGLHDVQSHGIASPLISMHYSQAWVESNREASYPSLCFKDRVHIIEYGVGWIRGQPWRPGQGRTPLTEGSPMIWDSISIVCGKPDRHHRPG